eukprot:1119002-Pyramimonas_sp.AAC.1
MRGGLSGIGRVPFCHVQKPRGGPFEAIAIILLQGINRGSTGGPFRSDRYNPSCGGHSERAHTRPEAVVPHRTNTSA